VLSGRVSSHIPRERSTQVNGETIKLMARVPTYIPMVRSMKVSGILTSSMAWARSAGRTAPSSLVRTETARRTAMGSTFGATGPHMRASGRRTISAATGTISGRMAAGILGTGAGILWTNSEYTPGKTEGSTRGSTERTKSMALVFTLGVTRNATLAGGATASSMASEFLSPKKGKGRLVYGMTEGNLDGSRWMK
jgi:hypothetical protein